MTFSELFTADIHNVQKAFERIQTEHFADEPFLNPELSVEVVPALEFTGPYGRQSVLVLITPWGISGLVLPGRGLPESMPVSNSRRPVMIVEEVRETGPYAQVVLAPDVSRYTTQEQARTIATSMIPVLLAGIGVDTDVDQP